jgi:hypothetical protein
MLTLLIGVFAFFWSALFAVVGVSLFVGLLIPLLLLVLVFRIGAMLVKVAAAVVLLVLFSVCLI